jgi:oxaloacetate decarboxylase alpha subunit
MAHIEFIDQSLRDGPQSLWGMRMRAYQAGPALPHLDDTGFRAIDLTGGGPFTVLVRQFRDDPWATLDFIIGRLGKTHKRSGVRTLAVGGFGFTPDAIIDLWIATLVKHGVDSLWLFDCLYDMPTMRSKAQVIIDAGGEVAPAIMYGLTDVHTDEFFAERAREMASWNGVKTIYLEDAAGVLTPDRAKTLLPALQKATGDVRIELHCHTTTGLAPLVYLEGLNAGIDIFHTVSLALANGPSLPSTEGMVENVEILGHSHGLDVSHLAPVAEHLAQSAADAGYPVGVPAEFRLLPYEHQLPGGMTGTLTNQLAQHGMEDRLRDVLEEIVIVRADLGEPIMATPFSQFVGIQAVLNIVLGERYKVVPDEVIQYAMGHYGPLPRPVVPEVQDRILSQPRAKDLAVWERPQPTLKEIRDQFGLSDEELLLRYLIPADAVDAMIEAGPIRTEPRSSTRNAIDNLADLLAQGQSLRRLTLSQPGLSIDVRRSAPG